ncbi:hypothetical protein LTR17_019315 [Elasticomyces elasticus]|nr:hypothetical protein LTR17_019315 [Elasticomyces elasticus]
MASYNTTDLLKAVQEGNRDFLPTLPVRRVHFKGPLGMLIAVLDDTRNGGIGLSVYVMPAAQEDRHVAEVFSLSKKMNEPWKRQHQDVYGDAALTWKADCIDYWKHFGCEQERTVFGSSEAAKAWHGNWLLRVWEKSTGFGLPDLEEGESKGDSAGEDVQEGLVNGVPPEMSSSPGTKRKALAMDEAEDAHEKREKGTAAMSVVAEVEEATKSAVDAGVHRDTKAKKAELLMEMEEIVRKRMEIDLQEIKVRRALLELECRAQPGDRVCQLYRTAVASITTADLLKAVANAEQSFISTLPTFPKANGSQGICVGTFETDTGDMVPAYVFPALKKGKYMANAFRIEDVNGKPTERPIKRYQMCTKWADDHLDFTKHFLSEEGLKQFGDPREAEVAHREWMLEAWKKNAGLEMPGYVIDRGQVPLPLVPNKWVVAKASEGRRTKPKIILRVREDAGGEASEGGEVPDSQKAKRANKRRKKRSASTVEVQGAGEIEQEVPKAVPHPPATAKTSIDLTMDEDEGVMPVKSENVTPSGDQSATVHPAVPMVDDEEDEEELEGRLKAIRAKEEALRAKQEAIDVENQLRAFRKRKRMESR